jgi:UV DNA damage repair endonuclease
MSSQYSQNIQHNHCNYSQYKSRICLGLCCINTELRERKKFPVFNSRTCIRKNFTIDKAKELALQNVRDLPEMMTWNHDNNIHCFRLSSDIFPHFTDTETEKYTIDFAEEDLIWAGGLSKAFNQRILMHPGQYNQVGTPNKKTFEKTIEDLYYEGKIKINSDDMAIIEDFGISKLISLYCTPGKKYDADYFKNNLYDITNVHKMTCFKIYYVMNIWREACDSYVQPIVLLTPTMNVNDVSQLTTTDYSYDSIIRYIQVLEVDSVYK